MLITHRIPRRDLGIPRHSVEAMLERSSARLLHTYLKRCDATETRDEAIQILASEIYDREIGPVMSAKDIDEATGEIFAGLDDAEQSEMRAAYEQGQKAYGEWLHPKIDAYWQAWCTEQARQQLDRLDREAEADHYRDQVAA